MPLPEENSIEEDRIDAYNEAELKNILKKASPREWRDTQDKSNIRFDSISAQVQYYEKLRIIDQRKEGNQFNNIKSKNPKYKNKKSNFEKGKDNSNVDQDAPCPIHGGSHTIRQCKLIQQEKKI